MSASLRGRLAAGWGLLGAAGLVAVLGARAAAAAGSGRPTLEVYVIEARRTDGGVTIDPALKGLPQLTRDQPFVRYNAYKLLEQRSFSLEADKPIVYALVNGRTLRAKLDGVSVDKREARYHMEARIEEPGKKAFLASLQVTTSANEPFFVGGQSYQGGTLFLELMVKP